ncbi:hypothetical protein LUZ60_015684 [Juncus effusus]|nr:hypothetical protein LUZ60_015684 [Juncus effusus]
MAVKIEENEVDIVIAALHPNLTPFLEAWRPFISPFHIIIVKDPDLNSDLQLAPDLDLQVITKAEMTAVVKSTKINFSGHSCRYFGYLISRKKYIISIDQDCVPAKDNTGTVTNAIQQHLINLSTPATPFFFNTLYDPYRPGTDFVRGYPFSMRTGAPCGLSCGLWLNYADFDAFTQAVKPSLRNDRYVDLVLTVPAGTMMPMSGINIAFDRLAVGPALLPGVHFTGEGKKRWETLEDIWAGFCVKKVCDRLALGVKSGLPYVWRESDGSKPHGSLNKESDKVKLLDEALPFFEKVRVSSSNAADCVAELAGLVRGELGKVSPVFEEAADAMEEWVGLWKTVGVSE